MSKYVSCRHEAHAHTEYSNESCGFADSTNKLTELIQYAYDIGLSSIAITDHESLSGHIQAIKYFNSMQKDRPFKLVLGNEIYLMGEQDYENNINGGESTPYYHFILNALDDVGHHQLRVLSSKAWYRAKSVKGRMRRPTLYDDFEEVIKPNQGHIIGSSACLGSQLDKHILQWKLDNDISAKAKIHKFITWCLDIFGKGNFFLEIQPCYEDNIEQRTVNQAMKILSKAYDIPIIVTTDAHYLRKEDRFVHKTFLQSQEGDREVDAFYQTTYVMDNEELGEYLSIDFSTEEINTIFQNTMLISDRVQEYHLDHAPIIPARPLEDIPEFTIKHTYKDYYDKYPYFKYYATDCTNIYDKYFFYRIEKALEEKIAKYHWDTDVYIARCNEEMEQLKLISDSFNDSMANYYVSMSKIVEIIWESGSLSMPARGSAGSFLTSYLLDIIQINPVPFGDEMPSWRHANLQRGIEIPD